MPKYIVPFTTWANISVEVDVPDGVTDPERIAELAMEAFQGTSLCHQCGGDRNSNLELGDDFEAVADLNTGVVIVTKLEG